ncbi:DUF4054 domain-containing protein [Brucella pseudogrignonensis]|uniref:DUF4054 domain-containing protein n=1 Tax=Brucella pseudogrignonensis TaxID=419475 RepID=UPI003ECE27EF
MAYDNLTPERFKVLKPQFAAVDDAVVQGYIDIASVFIDQSWPEKLYEQGWTAYTCHLMTMDGLGTDAESRSQASGRAQYQSIKSGELTLTRFQKAAGDMDYGDWLSQTKCGAYFFQLLKMVKVGPRVAIGAIGGCASGYAKDWQGPAYGWPGVFGGL